MAATSNGTMRLTRARRRPAGNLYGRVRLRGPRRAPWLPAAVIALLVAAWLLAILTGEWVRFVILAPRAKTGFEVLLALGQLFGALVLLLFPEEAARPRLRWVAMGLLVLGFGAFGFGYLLPLWDESPDLNTAMYGSLLARSLGTTLLAVGLWPARPPRLSVRAAVALLATLALLGALVAVTADRLPRLTTLTDLKAAAAGDQVMLDGLTAWHWALGLIPLALGVVAAAGAVRHFPGRALGSWLVAATAMLAGAHLHTLFWPSAYSSILTTASLLRLGFTAVVVVGGVLELRRVAAERAMLLAAAREHARQLTDLAALRADFTAMVAHELGAPIAAIRRSAELLALDPLDEAQRNALATIDSQVGVLQALVGDVLASSRIERDQFSVRLRPVPVGGLLADAAAIARTLPGDHLFTLAGGDLPDRVLCDPDRIGQVLRNLLGNAAKYTPAGTPIELRAVCRGDRIRIEVADRGPGIQHDDLVRIFEKYGRGRDASGRAAGAGLGLYVSRGIARAHGGELTVESAPGQGATFGFELEVAGKDRPRSSA